MKQTIFFSLIIISLLLLPNVLALNEVHLYFFHSQGCPHCASAQLFLNNLEEEFPSLQTNRYELHESENYFLLAEYCQACNVMMPDYVPIFFIDGHKYESMSDTVQSQIRAEVEKCLVQNCVDFEYNATQGTNNTLANNPTNPQKLIQDQNNKFEFVGWGFIIGIILIIIYFVIKRLRR